MGYWGSMALRGVNMGSRRVAAKERHLYRTLDTPKV